MIRVLIVDDEAMVRTGLRLVLDREEDIEVVGESGDGGAAIDAALTLGAHVVLMDIRMPGIDGIESTRRIVSRSDHVRVIILTTFDEDEYIYEALRAGAAGFLLKYAPADDLVAAIRVVAGGEAMLAPSVTRRLIESFASRDPARNTSALSSLSTREVEVLRLVANGLSNSEIAERLFVSRATVKTHVAHILEKLDVRDRVQATSFAYESGVMDG